MGKELNIGKFLDLYDDSLGNIFSLKAFGDLDSPISFL